MTRSRPGQELERFVAIFERLARGEPMDYSDRRNLARLLKALLGGADVSQWFYVPVEGRPRNDGFAIFVAADVELRRQPGHKVKSMRGAVAKAWGKSDLFVTRQHRRAGKFAREWIERSTPQAVAAVVDWHRERFRNSR